jgi:O-antigen biosynthesis protein WbqP
MRHSRLIRTFDFALAAAGLLATSPIVLAAAVVVRMTSAGPAIFAQPRVGQHERVFVCYKLRTMKAGTRSAASHEVTAAAITGVGAVLRRTKLDELPQLWNVLVGEMSLVGPRPCLPIQQEVIEARRNRQVFSVRPGITGLAQIRDIDMSDGPKLAEADAQWVEQGSVRTYLETILQTLRGKGSGDRAGRDQSAVK